MGDESQDVANDGSKVTITPDDVKHLENFFDFFKIPVPTRLQRVVDKLKADPNNFTIETQRELKIELAHAVASSEHELLKDGLFKNVMANCNKEWYEAQFERDVEDILSGEEA
jgi:hypothetical protein